MAEDMAQDLAQDRAQDSGPQPVRLTDYAPPDFLIDTVDLTFELDPTDTRVSATLTVRRNPAGRAGAPLVLDGEAVRLERVAVDGGDLGGNSYTRTDTSLTIPDLPDACTLAIVTRISPRDNTELSGLYTSGGSFFTQCEAQGFRRITYFLDRPDVMSRYTTTIIADPASCPVLLSNGNPAGTTVEGERAVARWVDPHPKPAYLFALVAGDLVSVDDSFVTRSGRHVDLHIWVRRGDEDRCDHAMRSLKKSMAWDEEVFGLEYDLDVFNIAAVSDFNMGAMENKGLNVFNTKYVLARPDTATDGDYLGIETVIAHEYFHNWTGNRITCRDWFQLSLKEGLTVFRDQEFSADQGSRAVKRIGDVRGLRAGQFSEDAGPLAHPVRPDSYIAIDNFYTATVYQKGAEVVRMIQTLIGREDFRRGMDLYVDRHDNQAVTIEDFVRCMQEASGVDLTQFSLWYAQAGTPELSVADSYDPASRTYALTLRQSVPPTPGQPVKQPMPIPVATGLLDAEGREFASRMLLLDAAERTFTFNDVPSRPTPSLLRGFSAPVKLRGLTRDAMRFLATHDSDPFVRWDSLQQFATSVLLDGVARRARGEAPEMPPALIESYRSAIAGAAGDPMYTAMLIGLPTQGFLGDQMDVDDVEGIAAVHDASRAAIATALRDALLGVYTEFDLPADAGRIDGAAIGRRSLKNAAMARLAEVDTDWGVRTAQAQFERAANMTDVLAALAVLNDIDTPERGRALDAFHAKWRDDPLVLDKWFSIQASTLRPTALDDVLALSRHPDFDLGNPNRMRALIGAFIGNRRAFHTASGAGYRFVADAIVQLDPRNSQVAARLVPALGKWRRFDAVRQGRMRAELERILGSAGLSRGTFEMVSRSLAA
jgi:aminopeptidase N